VRSYGLTLLLRDDPAAIDEYRACHQRVWPEVVARVREIGIAQMKIFLLDRRLFMYIDADDQFEPERDFPRLSEDPVSAKWEAQMASLQERAPEARSSEWWAEMEQVFDLNWPQFRPG
jgi:L-rhamnose mutarotase